MAGRTSHTAPELVQLGKAETVCILNDQGVGIGNVQAGFNDGGADQHLDFSLCHGLHHIAKSVFAHLSMSYTHTQAGNPTAQSTGTLVDGFSAVVQIVNLAAPFHLTSDCIVDDGSVIFRNKGLNRVTVRGRFLNGGHIPDAGERHVQGTGNGRGRQCQHIHTFGNLLQPFLVTDAETLLLVHNEQP